MNLKNLENMLDLGGRMITIKGLEKQIKDCDDEIEELECKIEQILEHKEEIKDKLEIAKTRRFTLHEFKDVSTERLYIFDNKTNLKYYLDDIGQIKEFCNTVNVINDKNTLLQIQVKK